MESIVINIVWIISGLGIILYPAVLLANVMSMRNGIDRETVSALEYWRKNLPWRIVQVLTTLFPVIEYACQRMSRDAFESGTMLPAVLWMLPPLLTTISIFWVFKRSKSGVAV